MHKSVKEFNNALKGTEGTELLEAFDYCADALDDDSFSAFIYGMTDGEFEKLLDAAVEVFVPNQIKRDPYQHLKYHGKNILGEDI